MSYVDVTPHKILSLLLAIVLGNIYIDISLLMENKEPFMLQIQNCTSEWNSSLTTHAAYWLMVTFNEPLNNCLYWALTT